MDITIHEVGTVHGHTRRDSCEAGVKGGGGHNAGLKVVGTTLDSRKDTERVFQADRMTGGRTRRATYLVSDGEKTIAQRSLERRMKLSHRWKGFCILGSEVLVLCSLKLFISIYKCLLKAYM